jgi:hypothetical protein
MKAGARINIFLILIALQHSIAYSQSVSGVVNSYYSITAVNTAGNIITVDNTSGLYAGQPVLLIQMKSAAITFTNTAGYGDISAINDAGNYEFNVICTISGNDVGLKNKLVNAYDPTGQVQLVTYPSYPSMTIAGTVTGQAWDPTTGKGGVVVLEATGTMTLNANIDVSGQGFRGGALVNYPIPPYNCDWATTVSDYFYDLPASGYYTGGMKGEGIAAYIANEEYGRGKLANGGGGGNNANSGGAGGGNYGAGGAGGQRSGESFFDCHAQYPGIGGAGLWAYGYSAGSNRIFMGGGGGSGEENNGAGTGGANGGGIIILSAATLVGGGGQLLANGSQPSNPANTDPLQAEGDGAGGGGAGGTIILNAATISGAITAQANGGQGSNSSNTVGDCTGPGGGGGGGVVWAAGASFPATVTASVNGGVNGVVSPGNTKSSCRGQSNGATSGSAGLVQAGYTAPVSTAPVCVLLATQPLQYFTATRANTGVLLSWALAAPTSVSGIRSFTIQRATDPAAFHPLASLPAFADSIRYHYTDAAGDVDGQVFYRLAWQDEAEVWMYSRILTLSVLAGPDDASMVVQPNPASEQVTITFYSWTAGSGDMRICNVLGQPLLSQQVWLQRGVNTFLLPVRKLASATYFAVLESEGRRHVKAFIRR